MQGKVKIMAWTSRQVDEDVIFVAFGKENAKEGSLVVEAGGNIEGHVVQISNSTTYKKVWESMFLFTLMPVCATGIYPLQSR